MDRIFFKKRDFCKLWHVVIILFLITIQVQGKAPSEIPGEEVTEEEFLKFKTVRDTILNDIPDNSPQSELWYDKASKSWLSPSIADQLDASENSLKAGMGGIFVPFMTDPEVEPEIDIVNTSGKILRRGKCGQIYNVLSGEYIVHVGSGSKNQRIIKRINVEEGKIRIIKPDWASISIKVIDKNNRTIRGEYEIARIDTFEAFGRGTGNDPSLGEEVDTWVLRPGLYKIFNVGASYNSLKNFTTVKLNPGEYVSYTLVQNDKEEIIGGGAVDVQATQSINSDWKYGVNIGGGIDLNYQNDREHPDDTTRYKNEIDLSLLLEANLSFIRKKVDWDVGLRIDEGIKVSDFEFDNLKSSVDELRLTSVFIWRILPILGPYQRVEGNMSLFPTSVKRAESSQQHYYIVLEDSTHSLNIIDSTDKESFRTKPPFSDIQLETGLGVNANLLRTRVLDVTVLGGFGLTYELNRDAYSVGDKSDIKEQNLTSEEFEQCTTIIANENYHVLIEAAGDRIEYGPEILLKTHLRLGRIATVISELKMFAPFLRKKEKGTKFKPDVSFSNNLSWRLISQLTLDYKFEYDLKQPDERELREDKVSHRFLLRFSFSKR